MITEKYLTIPVSWFDLDLTRTELFLLSEIINKLGFHPKCTISNKHFSDLLRIQRESVSRSLNDLKKKGFIDIKIIEGSRNHEREITINKMLFTPKQNVIDPLTKCLETKDINTLINTINNILSFLNGVVDKKYKATDKTKTLIKSRLKEGFTIEDFKYVIKIKSAEWKNEEKMKKYLRPETLFGTKFEGYLNQEEEASEGGFNYARYNK